ncbi:hypothetical protein V8G54_019902 [Vigna mungo]|uniref:Uncharacterized protein n=1 Tax=Vigna mungo TaxID=3915 RepID=A0AAQ3RW74_VIGMU
MMIVIKNDDDEDEDDEDEDENENENEEGDDEGAYAHFLQIKKWKEDWALKSDATLGLALTNVVDDGFVRRELLGANIFPIRNRLLDLKSGFRRIYIFHETKISFCIYLSTVTEMKKRKRREGWVDVRVCDRNGKEKEKM